MRSCEFSLVSGERRTEIVELKDIRFTRRDNSTVHHDSSNVISAYSISVEFTNQKNGEKNERTINMNTGDPVMNSVRQFAATVLHLRAHPDVTDRTPICSYVDEQGYLRKFSQH